MLYKEFITIIINNLFKMAIFDNYKKVREFLIKNSLTF